MRKASQLPDDAGLGPSIGQPPPALPGRIPSRENAGQDAGRLEPLGRMPAAGPPDRLPPGWADRVRSALPGGDRGLPASGPPRAEHTASAHGIGCHMRFPLATPCHIWSACDVASRQAPTTPDVTCASYLPPCAACGAHVTQGAAGTGRVAERAGRGRRGACGSGSPGGGGGTAAKPDRNTVEMAQLRGRTPDREGGRTGGLHRGSRNAETGDLPRFGRLRLSPGALVDLSSRHRAGHRAGRGGEG